MQDLAERREAVGVEVLHHQREGEIGMLRFQLCGSENHE
jgi:hypothetical protein